jgi:adenylate cyclase
VTPQPADLKSIVDWLMDGARSAPLPQDVMTALCERLTACGVPLCRGVIFVRTLHPQVLGRSFIWRPGTGTVVVEADFDLLDRETFRNSPMVAHNTGAMARYCLADPQCRMDYPILQDLRQEGVTDYVLAPLNFTNGEIHFASWATKQPGGFVDAQVAALDAVTMPLARIAEIRAAQRVAATLLSTYVGEKAGERVLAGQIRRGTTETIHAAIWLSDMRGFTKLADRMHPQDLVDLLNRYFDCQVPPILDRGGEVLKFMGDGLLAIFPFADGADAAAVCAGALKSAHEARDNVGKLDGPDDAAPHLRFGLALHIGDVLYGNIGGGNRLDFTCIGPAVNLAARLEKLAGQLGRTILASEDFAKYCGEGLQPLGKFAIAGFAAEQTVFGLSDENRELQ